jgi:hypothetical protein
MPLLIKGGGGGAGPTGPAGSASLAGGTIWILSSSQPSSPYASGLRYIPCRHAFSDYVEFQFIAAASGTAELRLALAMSSAEAVGVRWRVDRGLVAEGGDPTTALATGTAFTWTPLASVLRQDIDSRHSADLSFAVTKNDVVIIRITRLGTDGDDDHTGAARIIALTPVG